MTVSPTSCVERATPAWTMSRRISGQPRRSFRTEGSGISLMYRHSWIRGGVLFLISAVWVVRAEAQANLGDITQPIPVVNSGGHSAPVRSLIFTSADGLTLLSGGMDKV